jgi:hypothetical protein
VSSHGAVIYSSPLIVWYWPDQVVTELHCDPWFCQQTLKPTIWPPWSTSVRPARMNAPRAQPDEDTAVF